MRQGRRVSQQRRSSNAELGHQTIGLCFSALCALNLAHPGIQAGTEEAWPQEGGKSEKACCRSFWKKFLKETVVVNRITSVQAL
jgi:hypothetical protein